MRVKTLTEIPTAKGIIPAGQIIDIPRTVMEKLKGKVESLQGSAHTPKANTTAAALSKAEATVTTVWPPDVQTLVNWFEKLETPTEPFYLEPHRKVIDPEKFISSLRQDIAIGPASPRNRTGALLCDLKILRKNLH